jgi:hypothetical protein
MKNGIMSIVLYVNPPVPPFTKGGDGGIFMFCCARDEHGPSLEDKRKSVEEVKAKAVEAARKLETEKAAAVKTLAKVPVYEGNAVKFLSPNATKTRFPKNSREIFKYIPVFFGSFRV